MFFTAQSLQNILKLYGSFRRLVVLRLLAFEFYFAKAISEATYFIYIDKDRRHFLKANTCFNSDAGGIRAVTQ